MFSLKRLMSGAVAGGGPVELTDWAYVYAGLGAFPTVPSTTVTFAVNRDGSMTVSGTGGNESGTEPDPLIDWYKPEGATVGDDYEVRITVNSGTGFDTGTVGSWLALTSDRTWTRIYNSIGSSTVNFTIEIRTSAGATLASQTCDITQTGGYS